MPPSPAFLVWSPQFSVAPYLIRLVQSLPPRPGGKQLFEWVYNEDVIEVPDMGALSTPASHSISPYFMGDLPSLAPHSLLIQGRPSYKRKAYALHSLLFQFLSFPSSLTYGSFGYCLLLLFSLSFLIRGKTEKEQRRAGVRGEGGTTEWTGSTFVAGSMLLLEAMALWFKVISGVTRWGVRWVGGYPSIYVMIQT